MLKWNLYSQLGKKSLCQKTNSVLYCEKAINEYTQLEFSKLFIKLLLNIHFSDMSRRMRKPTVVCEQVRHKLGCTVTEAG